MATKNLKKFCIILVHREFIAQKSGRTKAGHPHISDPAFRKQRDQTVLSKIRLPAHRYGSNIHKKLDTSLDEGANEVVTCTLLVSDCMYSRRAASDDVFLLRLSTGYTQAGSNL
jgi:hypothetical protein